MSNENFKKEINTYIDEIKKDFNDNLDNISKIKNIIDKNKGYITTKEITNNKISRDYLKKMVANNDIVKVERGIYIDSSIIEDPFYTFQLRYPNTLFSHFTALSFFGLTELIPYTYDITCVNNIYSNNFKDYNMFYVKKEWYDIGLTEVVDNYGYKIKTYDIERCICDIIRSKTRLDMEQVKKSVRSYIKRKDKNLINLSIYSKKMRIYDEVMSFVGMYEE